nr:hypothetical protein [Tanacetum cinerariifolium]
MDLPFDNIDVTNLVPNDVLEGEDVDVINLDSFKSNPGSDDETTDYKRRRLAKLSIEIEGVINASGQCFRACRRDLLGLDGAFMKGPFPGQVLAAVGLDSNNGIYLLKYALVEAE